MKKGEALCFMEHIDSDLIEESETYKKSKKKNAWVKWGAMAACLCLVVAGAGTLLFPKQYDTMPGDPVQSVITGDPIKQRNADSEEVVTAPDETPTEETDLPDITKADDSPQFIGGFGGQAKEETYMTCTFADPYGDIRLPVISEDLSAETLPVYNLIADCSTDDLKENYEEFASLIENREEFIESCTGNGEDAYQMSLFIPDSGEEYTGTLMDSINGSAIVIRSMKNGITIGCPLENNTQQRVNHDYILELLTKDPVLKAACKYAGINTPELYYNHQYTTNPDYPQWADYEIVEAGTDAETTAENLLLHGMSLFISEDSLSIILRDFTEAEKDIRVEGTYRLASYSEAKTVFLEKYNLSEEDIIQSGFQYRNLEDPNVYIPCYEFIVKNDSIPLPEYFDSAVYANYDLIAISALS